MIVMEVGLLMKVGFEVIAHEYLNNTDLKKFINHMLM